MRSVRLGGAGWYPRGCWTTEADPVALDEAVAEVAGWVGFILPTLQQVGRGQDAVEVYQTCRTAANRASGPGGQHAGARLMVFELSASADAYAKARVADRWSEVAANVLEAIRAGLWSIDTLRGYAAGGPLQATELARTLQVVGRLMLVAGQLTESAAMLDEAVATAATVADHGPHYRSLLRQFEAERDGLRGAVHDPPATTETDHSPVAAVPTCRQLRT